MEDVKKKKKKKNKHKQNKTPEDAASSMVQKHQSNGDHDDSHQRFFIADGQQHNDAKTTNGDQNKLTPVDADEIQSNSVESQKQQWLEREADLERKLALLQMEKDSWLQKEENLEERNKQLEREKASFVVQENSSKEMISSLNDYIARLQAQVLELEASLRYLLQKKRQLVENFSTVSTRMEAANPPIENLMMENTQLVEKVNEHYVALDPRSATNRISSSVEGHPVVDTVDPVSEHTQFLIEQKLESQYVPITDERIDSDHEDTDPAIDSLKPLAEESGEIVQIQLTDNKEQDPEVQSAVLLSDAPLIGAPFRLISYFARYVSGADLVNNNSVNSSN